MAGSVEEVQDSSPAQVARAEVEAGSVEKVPVELPAPEGWKKKLFPKKQGGTPKRDEIVYFSPTGEEIRTRVQLDRYLKTHPGGPAVSEFHWSTGGTPRRSSRLSEKAQVETETPESESKKKPKRARKSEGESEATEERPKKKSKTPLAEVEADKEQDVQNVDHREGLMEEEAAAEETVRQKKRSKSPLAGVEADKEEDMQNVDHREGLMEEESAAEETVRQKKRSKSPLAEVEADKEEDMQNVDHREGLMEEEPAAEETVRAVGSKEDEEEEEKQENLEMKLDEKVEGSKAEDVEMQETCERAEEKEPEVHVEEDRLVKEQEIQAEGEKSNKESEVHVIEDKLEKMTGVHVDEHKVGEEPEIYVEKDTSVKKPEVHVEELEKVQAEEVKSEDNQTEQNGAVTKPGRSTDLEPQETLVANTDNGLDATNLEVNSIQNKPPPETLDDASPELIEKHLSQEAVNPQEVHSSCNAAGQQPSEPLGESC